MTDTRKAQLEIGVNSGPAEEGFKRIQSQGKAMADGLGASADKAGKAVSGIGDGAAKAAQKVDRETSKIQASLQRANAAYEAGAKGTAKYWETLARNRGADLPTLRPLLDEMRALEIAQGKVGVSAAQTAAAMRNVPAQFTDIITSLQGGQAPMTVLFQQGGQLKDMFGGIGNAAKALGGYVLGLVNPFTVLAAAAGAVGVAWYQGSKEAEAYNKALILSGNAVGTTAGQLQTMARSMSGFGTTQGAAAEALATFAQSANVGKNNLESFTLAAMRFSKVTGQSVGDVAKQFADLAKDPLQATIKLNEGMNYLSMATYTAIKALQEQGKATEAAALAQKAFADAGTDIGKNYQASLGTLERGWNAVAKAVSGAWDAVKNVGREAGPEGQLQALQTGLAASVKKRAEIGSDSAFAPELDKQIARLREQESILQSTVREIRKGVDLRAQEAEQVKARAEADKDGLKYLNDQQRMQRDIAQQSGALRRAKASEAEIEERIAQIKASYAKKDAGGTRGDSELTAIRAKIEATKEYATRLANLGITNPKLTDAEQQVIKIQQELQGSITGTARAQKELALAEAGRLINLEITARGLERSRGEYDAMVSATAKSADTIAQQAAQQEAANLVFGKGTTAVQAYTLALLKNQLAEAEGSDRFTAQYIAALQLKIDAQERFVKALNAADYKTLNAGLDEWLRSSTEAGKLYADEARLAGLTSLERAKVVARRQVELQLAKEISKIDQSTLGDAEKEALRQKARDTATVASATATAKAVQDEWTKVSDQINQSLTDALMRGFENGKTFAQNLKDTVINMFKTMVLRPIVQGVLAPVSGAIAGAMGYSNTAMAGTSQAAQMMNIGSSMSNLYSTITGSFAALGDKVAFAAQDIGAWLTTNTTGVLNEAGASLMSNAGAIGTGASYAGGALVGYGVGKAISGKYTTSAGKDTLETAGVIVGSILGGPIGGAIGGAIGGLVNRAFGTGPREVTAAGIRGTFSASGADVRQFETWKKDGGWFRSNKGGTDFTAINSELGQFLDGAVRMTSSATKAYANAIGLSADAVSGFSKAIDISLQGLDAAGQEKAIAAAISGFGEDMAKAVIGDAGKALQRQGETASAALVRLATSLGGVNDVLKMLGQTALQISLTGASAASSLVDAFGGIDAYAASASQYLESYYTDAERTTIAQKNLSDALAQYGLRLPASTQQYRALVEAQNLSTDSGRKAYAMLLQLAPAFAGVTGQLEQTYAAAISAGKPQTLAGLQGDVEKQFAAAQATLYGGVEKTLKLVIGTFSIWGQTFARVERKWVDVPIRLAASLPKTIDEFEKLVSAQDQTTEAGKKARQALMDMAPAFVQLIQAQEQAKAAIAQQRQGLQDQLDTLLGNTAALRARERAALDESNRALYDQIQALKDSQAAAQAATEAEKARVDAIKSASTTVLDEIKRLRGVTGQSTDKAYLQAQFATLTGQARAGDAAALAKLPEVSQAIEQASKITAATSLDMARMRAWLAGSLSDTIRALGLSVPAFAAGGTHTGGLRLVGERGPELEVTGPARYLSAADTMAALQGGGSNAALVAEVRALREEMQGLRAEARATAVSTSKTARTLDRVTQGTDSLMTQQVTA
jgi:phage-related minor tail protein